MDTTEQLSTNAQARHLLGFLFLLLFLTFPHDLFQIMHFQQEYQRCDVVVLLCVSHQAHKSHLVPWSAVLIIWAVTMSLLCN